MKELISRLREAADLLRKGVNIPSHVAVIQDAISTLEKMCWIPVTEATKPDKYQEVLTTIVGTDLIFQEEGETLEEAVERARRSHVRVTMSFLDDDGYWNDAFMGGPEIIQPSYWMPKPAPPKEALK